jgi:hypothetical protein
MTARDAYGMPYRADIFETTALRAWPHRKPHPFASALSVSVRSLRGADAPQSRLQTAERAPEASRRRERAARSPHPGLAPVREGRSPRAVRDYTQYMRLFIFLDARDTDTDARPRLRLAPLTLRFYYTRACGALCGVCLCVWRRRAGETVDISVFFNTLRCNRWPRAAARSTPS